MDNNTPHPNTPGHYEETHEGLTFVPATEPGRREVGSVVTVHDLDRDHEGTVVRASSASVDVELRETGAVWRFWDWPTLHLANAKVIR